MERMGQIIKVGITGNNGFIGSHLNNFLSTKLNEIEIIYFKRSYFDDDTKLQNFVSFCDIIIHAAAMNRHEDEQFIYNTNVTLTHKIINACKFTESRPKIIFCSSTQETKDNLYGKSKKDSKKDLEDWASENSGEVLSLIIPNVFGPFAKPHYNSFIATFSNQLIHDENSKINDNEVKLIYVNDLSKIIYNEIINKKVETIRSFEIPHTSSRKVSEIYKLLKDYKLQYFDNGQLPKVDLNSFELDLFNTFRSYLSKDYFPVKFTKHEDDRGAFVEIMRASSAGQSSYSTTNPGITRGNHFHTRKIERFAVISGKASIKLRKVNTDEIYEYILDGNEPAYVDMPIWFTHNITNIGDTELITLFWINEPYNSDDSDTYFNEV